jgi:hypothetical protein
VRKTGLFDKLAGIASGSVHAAGALIGIMCASVLLFPAHATDTANLAAADANAAIPPLMQEPGVAWDGRFPNRRALSAQERVFYDRLQNDWLPPLSGIGPMTADPAHPYYANVVANDLHVAPSYRVADLNSPTAKNLMPWALDALRKQNALVLANRNGETRQARCWETGVPDIHEAPWEMYFIQTPKEVVMMLSGAGPMVRRVYLNVPHSKNPKPSWFGESVGHYENGDTLVVDTIGLSDRTFVDGYRTPHTNQLHVVERFKITDGGKTLDVSFVADDPGTFYKPWSARKPRYRVAFPYDERVCAAFNDDIMHQGFDPVPTAVKPDF